MGSKLAGLYQGLSNIAAQANQIQQTNRAKAEAEAERKRQRLEQIQMLAMQLGINPNENVMTGPIQAQKMVADTAPSNTGTPVPWMPDGWPQDAQIPQPMDAQGRLQPRDQNTNIPMLQNFRNVPVTLDSVATGETRERPTNDLMSTISQFVGNKNEKERVSALAALKEAQRKQDFDEKNITTDNDLAAAKESREKQENIDKAAATKAELDRKNKEFEAQEKRLREDAAAGRTSSLTTGIALENLRAQHARELADYNAGLKADSNYTIKYGNISGPSMAKLQGVMKVTKVFDEIMGNIDQVLKASGHADRTYDTLGTYFEGDGAAAVRGMMSNLMSTISSEDAGKAWTANELEILRTQVPQIMNWSGDNDAQVKAKLDWLKKNIAIKLKSVLVPEVASGRKINMDLLKKDLGSFGNELDGIPSSTDAPPSGARPSASDEFDDILKKARPSR